MNGQRLDPERLSRSLANLPRTDCDPHCVREYRSAGVLAPLLQRDGGWHLLFIRRTRFDGDRHSGQVAFAGGKREDQDADIRATALREAREELGITHERLHLLGALPSYHSRTGYCITAQVAILDWPCPLTPQPREVARVFSLPLEWLADAANWHLQWLPDDPASPRYTIRYRDRDGECLWGATAVMVQYLLQALSSSVG